MDPSCDPEVRHGGRCRPPMFTKQVSRRVDGLDPPSWYPRPSRSSQLEQRPAHGPNPSFCALQGVVLLVVGTEMVLVQNREYGFFPLAWGVVAIALGWRSLTVPRGKRTRAKRGWPPWDFWGLPTRILLIAAGFGLAGIYLVVIATIDFGDGNIGGGLFALIGAGCGFYFPVRTGLEVRRMRRQAHRNSQQTQEQPDDASANS